ncbi:hypothetical protein OXB_2902 [Bacillus sp. OxB-1]|uniref:hypothetical protein n=1 Tax=Bacillus sp. (strain OxB-1) TaxID=98228 RepID=UPI00058237BE|nr:hypothetical protein [Bacillus sp. OxB-1]BAQ11373.1 hypothetical protein OXB_2902 [Bacillus sp. OxB-1]
MDIPLLLLGIGLILVIASFFVRGSNGRYADELEKISISLHQETNHLKKRLKTVEEELMIGIGGSPNLPVNSTHVKKTAPKPIHEIIVNQILSLHAQGYTIGEIAIRSSLSNEDVIHVLSSRGMLK